MNALNSPVLCLNKSWRAVNVLRAAEALTKVWLEKAKIVDPNDYCTYEWEDWSRIDPKNGDKFIRSPNVTVKVPEVIVLECNKMPRVGVAFNRRNLYARDNYTCQYCAKKLVREDVTIDHVIPRSKGGKSTWENTVVACYQCNCFKKDRDLQHSGLKLLREPKQPKWLPIFHGGQVLDSWEKFVDEIYWSVPLSN